MRTTYWVWRRELAVTLRAPIVYVIGGLFLVVQGIAFAGLVGELSDPRRPAPLGALLEGQLAGTLLTWVLQLVVLTLLGMRAIADERRAGGWELLLTAGVSEFAAVVGKWLAATTVYALLWLPTLAYLAVVAVFRADAGGWDLASIACGYAGAIALGAALLAWAIAASAATTSSLAAGGLGFAMLVGLFLVGEVPTVWPGLDGRVFEALGLRAHLTELRARRARARASVELVVGLAATGLSLAIALACAGRRRARGVWRRLAATALIADDRDARRCDHRSAPARVGRQRGRAQLARSGNACGDRGVARARDADDRRADARRARRALRRGRRASPTRMADAGAVRVRRVNPAALPGGLAAAARLAGVQPKELAEDGGVVVELGGKQRVVDVLQLATIDRGAGGAPRFERLAIEQAIAGALAELAATAPITVCATTGHDELSLTTASATGADWTLVANRLAAAGITVRELPDVAHLAGCAAVIVAGPTRALSPDEALALQHYVAGGGGLLVAAASRPVPNGPQLAATGLEPVLAAEGLGLPLAIAVDPSLAIREVPGALMIVDGYAAHPIDAGFAGARRTLWFQPRVVVATGAARALVSATAESWGERDLVHGPPTKDSDDLAGPVALAAIGGAHRVDRDRLGRVVRDRGALGRRIGGRPVARARRAVRRRPAGAACRARARRGSGAARDDVRRAPHRRRAVRRGHPARVAAARRRDPRVATEARVIASLRGLVDARGDRRRARVGRRAAPRRRAGRPRGACPGFTGDAHVLRWERSVGEHARRSRRRSLDDGHAHARFARDRQPCSSALRGARWHRRAERARAGAIHATLFVDGLDVSFGQPLEGVDQAWLVVDGHALLVDGWVARALEPQTLALIDREPFAAAASGAIRDLAARRRRCPERRGARRWASPRRRRTAALISALTAVADRAAADGERVGDGRPARRVAGDRRRWRVCAGCARSSRSTRRRATAASSRPRGRP